MRPQEIRALSDVELQARLRSVQEELFNLRFQMAIGQLQNYNRLTELKRDIARLKTEMRMRELRRQSA
ncbi:MAG: 50S ribosomal protein L29 [Ardenticatenia bacterium]|nr:MAG: 50S ribosomal protein L29 [Ardenticatenia bacterium]